MPVMNKCVRNEAATRMFTLFSLFLMGCSSPSMGPVEHFKKIDEETVAVRNADHISTSTIEYTKVPRIIDVPGKIAIPDKDLFILSSRVAGRLESLLVTVGDRVEKGKIIAEIWSPDISTAADELVIAEREGNKDLAVLAKEKLLSLGVNPADVHVNAKRIPLRAPVGGAVIDRKLTIGAAIQPGDAILTIARLGDHQFEGDIVPEQAAVIKAGMPVLFEDEPGLTAVVTTVSPVADPVSHLVKVRCRFTSPVPPKLPQETFLKGQVVISESDALIAPATALVLTGKGEFVFVQSPDNNQDGDAHFRRIKVTVQVRAKKYIALASSEGIRPGLDIVCEGALLLNNILDNEE